jgi:peptide deformylase
LHHGLGFDPRPFPLKNMALIQWHTIKHLKGGLFLDLLQTQSQKGQNFKNPTIE